MFKPPKTHQLWKKNDYRAQKKGIRNTIYSINGDEYTGEWLNNMKHVSNAAYGGRRSLIGGDYQPWQYSDFAYVVGGKGTYVSSTMNSIYSGDWSTDEKSGFGTYSVKDSNGEYQKQYAGGWKNNLKHGYGTRFYKDKERYEGEWYQGNRSGWGRMYYKDGSTYDGEWLGDKRSGIGLLRMSDNNRYEGNWKHGLKNGPGKYYYTDKGQIYEGVWVDNIAKCGNMVDANRENATHATPYPIPEVELADPTGLLEQVKNDLQADIE